MLLNMLNDLAEATKASDGKKKARSSGVARSSAEGLVLTSGGGKFFSRSASYKHHDPQLRINYPHFAWPAYFKSE